MKIQDQVNVTCTSLLRVKLDDHFRQKFEYASHRSTDLNVRIGIWSEDKSISVYYKVSTAVYYKVYTAVCDLF